MGDSGSNGAAVGGRIPPHNLEVERSTLGGVLIKPTAFDEIRSLLQADDYFLPAHREIWDAMVALEKRRQPIDIVALSDEMTTRGTLNRLEGGVAYLANLVDAVGTVANLEHYARMVKEKSTLRQLIATCSEVQSRAYGDFGEYEEFLDEAETLIFNVAQKTRTQAYSAVGELIDDVLQNIEDRARTRKDITGLPTGFNTFDKLTAGLQPETLNIVAARPGMGKTSWALNVAVNAAVKHQMPVLIFSLEMSKFELMERMLSSVALVDSTALKKGVFEYSIWKNKIYPAGMELSKAPILIDDSGAPTILDIRAKARRFRADPNLFPPPKPDENGRVPRQLGLVVVDYLQLARGPGGRRDESREREIAEISRGLKALAKEIKVPIIAVSQLNRGLEKREDKRPQLSDLRESGAIEQDADMIMFIHRDEMFNRDSEDKGLAELIVAKHRSGPTGVAKMTFRGQYTKFENYAEEEDVPFE